MPKKVVYIAGSITDDPDYHAKFTAAEAELTWSGYIALSPAWPPGGLTNGQYMKICLAMIDAADAVLFLEDAELSKGARLEALYCDYISKPVACRVSDLDYAIRSLYLTSNLSAVELLENLKKKKGAKNGNKKAAT